MVGDTSVVGKLDLKVGEWVVVRSAEEILTTLDANARFEELPFMPQMLQRCGRKFQVRKRAHKLCDTAFGTGGRQLTDAVFLNDTRCDGDSYGGCELRCTIIWKEAWLRRATCRNTCRRSSRPRKRAQSAPSAGRRRPHCRDRSERELAAAASHPARIWPARTSTRSFSTAT